MSGMKFADIGRFSFKALRERRLRSILTILMVAIGIALITALNGLSGGINVFISDQLNTLAPNVLTITPSNPLAGLPRPGQGPPPGAFGGGTTPRISLTTLTVKAIHALPGVEEVLPSFRGSVQIVSGGKAQSSQMIGLDSTKLPHIIPSLELEAGGLIQPTDVTGIGFGFNVAHPSGEEQPFTSVGSLVTVQWERFDEIRQQYVTDKKSFIVRGIMKETGNPQYDNAALIPLSVADSMLRKSSKYDSILVVTEDSALNASVEEAIRGIYGDDIGITSPEVLLRTINTVISGFTLFISAIGGVSILVGGVGTVTTLFTSVMERTKEVGTLKAIGATGRTILLIFLAESVIIGVLGGGTGLILGAGLALVLGPLISGLSGGGGNFPSFTPIFSVQVVVVILFAGILVSSIAGLYPAWRASRLLPVEALRKE